MTLVTVEFTYPWETQVADAVLKRMQDRLDLIMDCVMDEIIDVSPNDPDPVGHHRGQEKLVDSWSCERNGYTITFRNTSPQATYLYKGTGIYSPESKPVRAHGKGLMVFPWRYREYNWYAMKEVRGINPRHIGENVGYDFAEDLDKAVHRGIKEAMSKRLIV